MSVFEIILLTITALAGFSIVWSTITLGISPMPSSNKARQAMLQMMDEIDLEAGTHFKTDPIFELGCGWGGLLIPLAKKYPTREIVGYELSLIPWFITLLRAKLLGLKNIRLHRRDFLQADLYNASIIICYLFPEGMKALERKLEQGGFNADNENLRYLISNNFSLPSHNPIKTIQLNDLYQSPVYLYKF